MAIIYPPSGGKIYGDTNVYPPSGGKIYPGTAYPSGLNPNWPFTDIPLPPFLWRPDLTGDYSNVGSDGVALNLTPLAGTPTGAFNNGWIVSNPTGSLGSAANTAVNPDVSNLGAQFSILLKSKPYKQGLWLVGTNYTYGPQYYLTYQREAPLSIFFTDGTNVIAKNGTLVLQDGVEYTIILTFNGGVLHLYIDSVEDTLVDAGSTGTLTSMPDTGQGLYFGDDDAPDYPMGDGTIYKVAAIAKGIVYTPAQVTEITAGLG